MEHRITECNYVSAVVDPLNVATLSEVGTSLYLLAVGHPKTRTCDIAQYHKNCIVRRRENRPLKFSREGFGMSGYRKCWLSLLFHDDCPPRPRPHTSLSASILHGSAVGSLSRQRTLCTKFLWWHIYQLGIMVCIYLRHH
jgi:hypothetical protein